MAKRSKHSELMAGLFVVVALAAGLAVVLWLGAADVFQRVYQTAWFYTVEGDTTAGLEPGNDAFVGSTHIGKIVESRFEPASGRTYYAVRVGRPDVTVHANAVAVADAGLLGGVRLVITNRGSGELADREHAVPIGAGGLLGGVTERLEAIASSLQRETDANQPGSLMAKVHMIMDDIESVSSNVMAETDRTRRDAMLSKLLRSVDDLNAITADIRSQTDPNRPGTAMSSVVAIATDLSAITATLRGETDPNRQNSLLARLQNTMTNVEATSGTIRAYVDRDLPEILAQVRVISDRTLKTVTAVDGLIERNGGNIDEIVDNLTIASEELKGGIEDLRRSPWKILDKPEKGEIERQCLYDAARAFSSGASQVDQALTRMGSIDPNVATPDQLKAVRAQLKESFDRFTEAERVLWRKLNDEKK